MTKKMNLLGGIAVALSFASCASHYKLENVQRSRITIDARFDNNKDAQAAAFLAPYKHQVDSIMSPIAVSYTHLTLPTTERV